MRKQPILTGFPRATLATARRVAQAKLRRTRETLLTSGASGYSGLFGDVLDPAFLASVDPTRRQRVYGHIPVLWAWLGQVLEGNAPCSRGVALVAAWHAGAGLPAPSSDTTSYCSARLRMDDGFLEAVSARVNDDLSRAAGDRGIWRGLRPKAFDGSSLGLADTEANQEEFPQPSSQKPGCGFPVMGFCAAFDLCSGAMLGYVTAEQDTHDAVMAPRLMGHLGAGDLLLADRAFCSYEIFAAARGRGAHALMRLHQARHRALDWRRGKRVSKNERIVSWKRPVQPKTSRLSSEAWRALPESIEVRYVRTGFEDRYGEKRRLVVATTLTDPRAHPWDEVAELYYRRWEIEVRFRDIKTSMGMEIVEVKTPEMARRSLRMAMIAYNLMRLLMARASSSSDLPIARMSYCGAMVNSTTLQPLFSGLLYRPRLRAAMLARLYEAIASSPLPNRPFRCDPRAVKRRPKGYKLLTAPRHLFREEPHRQKKRSGA